jgi:neutral ceramidase
MVGRKYLMFNCPEQARIGESLNNFSAIPDGGYSGRMRSLLFALVVGLSCVGCVAPAPPLEVGVAVREITPPVGYRLAGYYFERRSTGVHDPLYAKAIVFRQGETRFALIECDLCQTSSEVVARARAEIERTLGIPADHVCIASTHTHTGPDYFGPLAEHLHRLAAEANGGKDPADTVDYPALLAGRIVEAVTEAAGRTRWLEMEVGSAAQPDVAFNRRYVLNDGTVATNPGKNNPKVVRPAGPVEERVSFLALRPPQSTRIMNYEAVLTNFPLHPDTEGGTEFSGDFPHFYGEKLRELTGRPELVSVFAQGTSGNINHVNVNTADPQKGIGEAERIGVALAGRVAEAMKEGRHATPASLAVATTRVELPLQQYTPEEVANARSLFAKIQERKLPFLVGVKAVKIVKIVDRYHGGPISAQVQAVRLAHDVAIVMLPSELFVEFGLEIKRRSPFKHTFVIELANDSFGYVPTRKAFEQGAYEPTNATVAPEAGEKLTEAAIGLLEQLHQ